MKRTSVECPYSPSCFTCPMGDCVASFPGVNVSALNVLPGDLERARKEKIPQHPRKRIAESMLTHYEVEECTDVSQNYAV